MQNGETKKETLGPQAQALLMAQEQQINELNVKITRLKADVILRDSVIKQMQADSAQKQESVSDAKESGAELKADAN